MIGNDVYVKVNTHLVYSLFMGICPLSLRCHQSKTFVTYHHHQCSHTGYERIIRCRRILPTLSVAATKILYNLKISLISLRRKNFKWKARRKLRSYKVCCWKKHVCWTLQTDLQSFAKRALCNNFFLLLQLLELEEVVCSSRQNVYQICTCKSIPLCQ